MKSFSFLQRYRKPLLGVCLVHTALLLASCQSENGNNTVSTLTETPSPTATMSAGSTTPLTVKAGTLTQVFVPGENEKLTVHKLSPKSLEAQNKSGNMTAALQEVVMAAPQYFPKGTKVNTAKVTGDKVVVDLTQPFADGQFWSQNGEKTTELAVYSLVNSAAQAANIKGVELTVGGKPISSLGEFDTAGPIEPEAELMGKS